MPHYQKMQYNQTLQHPSKQHHLHIPVIANENPTPAETTSTLLHPGVAKLIPWAWDAYAVYNPPHGMNMGGAPRATSKNSSCLRVCILYVHVCIWMQVGQGWSEQQ